MIRVVEPVALLHESRHLLSALIDRRPLTVLALDFSAGLPSVLIFSTLSIWLRDVDVSARDHWRRATEP
jgi:hypothetical protein